MHVAFGHPYAACTGATYDSPVQVDVVMEQTRVWVGDQQIMADGRFIY